MCCIDHGCSLKRFESVSGRLSAVSFQQLRGLRYEQVGAGGVGGYEAVEAIGASVDEAAGGGEVVGGEGAADGGLLVGEEAGEELGGDGG